MGSYFSHEDSDTNTNNRVPNKDDVLSQFGQAKSDPLPNHINVIVWNIYKGRKNAFEKEFKELTVDCKIILLQEMYLQEELLSIYGYNPEMQWEHATNFFMKGIRTGVGTGSVSKPLMVNFSVSEDVEPFVSLPKTIVITEYAIEGLPQNLLVLNIHGINFKGTQGLENQVNQVIPIMRDHEGPVIFAGDFNTKNNERVEVLENMLKNVGLKSVVWDNPIQGKQLDQAYVRGIKVDKAHIITEVLGSDHPALSLELSFNL